MSSHSTLFPRTDISPYPPSVWKLAAHAGSAPTHDFLIPKLANRESAADLAVEFVHFDPSNPTEMEELQRHEELVHLTGPAFQSLVAESAHGHFALPH